MRTRILGALAGAAAMLCVAGQADAAVFTLTFDGVITSGWDNVYNQGSGVLGVNGDLTGYAFKSVYHVDTAKPGATPASFGPGESHIDGYDAAAPILGSITINGVTVDVSPSFPPLYSIYTEASTAFAGFDQIEAATQTYDIQSYFDANGGYHFVFDSQQIQNGVYSFVNEFSDGDILTAPGSYTPDANDNVYGYFSDTHQTYDAGNGLNTFTYAYLQFTSLTVSAGAAAAPEPAAWALMIAGFGGMGVALRRRRATLAA